jgi:tagaturonate epimerase
MTSPAPISLGPRLTTALGAPGGHVFTDHLNSVAACSRAPVIIHPPGGNPRELADATRASLENHGWRAPWGLGGTCNTMEDAANFATAGFTWFQFALSAHLDSRADEMTLDELDAAIIALEDAGSYAPGWHERYLAAEVGLADGSRFRFTDEQLARAAVKFGRALAHAGQLSDALRTLWSGRDTPPDIEASIATSAAPSLPAEIIFLARELLRRGIGSAGHLRIAPSFGAVCEPGCEVEDAPGLSPDDRPAGSEISIPAALAADARWLRAHHDNRDASALAALRIAATHAPSFFREWLAAACDAFPSSRGGRTYRTTDDDIRFLPQATDAELAPTFLDEPQGRQLLLVTWDEVYRQLGPRLSALHA